MDLYRRMQLNLIDIPTQMLIMIGTLNKKLDLKNENTI
jgi:hypothetical protein